MPRPKTYKNERVQMQIRLPAKIRLRLEKESERRTVSKNFLVERAIEEMLEQWESEKLVTA